MPRSACTIALVWIASVYMGHGLRRQSSRKLMQDSSHKQTQRRLHAIAETNQSQSNLATDASASLALLLLRCDGPAVGWHFAELKSKCQTIRPRGRVHCCAVLSKPVEKEIQPLVDLHSLLTSCDASQTWDNARWISAANLLRDASVECAREADDFAKMRDFIRQMKEEGKYVPESGPVLAEAQRLCRDVLQSLKASSSELYPIAKRSARRNWIAQGEIQRSGYRDIERCLIELGLLCGTYAALEPGEERTAFLADVRPIVRYAPIQERLRWLLVVCRGYHSPGVGAASGWRLGKKTVQQELRDWHLPERNAIKPRLEASSELVRQHSLRLRAAFALLDPALQLWLRGLEPDEQPEAALSGELGTATLLLWLVEYGGHEGARLATAAARWAVDTLLLSVDAGSIAPDRHGGPSWEMLGRSYSSEGALLLLSAHSALVKGKKFPQKRWMSGVERVGHAVWLMLLTANDTISAGKVESQSIASNIPSAAEMSDLLLQRIRAVMLSCYILERSDELRPKLYDAMSNAQAEPSWVRRLFSHAVLGIAEEGDEDDDEDVSATLRYHDASDELSTRWLNKLLTWSDPQLIFKYLELHREDESATMLTRQWMLALLGASHETLHQLRCESPQNAKHFALIAESSKAAAQAVQLWLESDRCSCDDNAACIDKASEEEHVWGTCDPQSFFMMGEELGTCMRIDRQCTRENIALLSYLAQGSSRLLRIRRSRQSRNIAELADTIRRRDMEGENSRDEQETAIRAIVRLIARADDFSPVLFVDQPLFGDMPPRLSADGETEEKARLNAELVQSAMRLGEALGVPVVMWDKCVPPPELSMELSENIRLSNGDVATQKRFLGHVPPNSTALVEIDGAAPYVYSNLRGKVTRGDDPKGTAALEALGQGQGLDMERAVVHALIML